MRLGSLEAGGTKMVVAIIESTDQSILERASFPTEEPSKTMPILIDWFKSRNISALGIGSFGPVDLDPASSTYGFITSTPKLAWRDYNILGEFKKALGVPCAFDTDVNAAAIGENQYGCLKGLSDGIYITIGTGVGVGVISNGAPLHGMLHPEAGHILLSKNVKDSYSGKCPYHKTCFEGLAAGPAIEGRYGKKGFELADVPEVWELEAEYIAQALVNYIMILSPKKIVLGGGVMKQEQLFPLVRKKTKELLGGYINTREINALDDYIVPPSLNDNQAILGCAYMASQLIK